MAGLASVLTLGDLARAAQQQLGPLAPPVKAGGPLSDEVQRVIRQIGVSDIKRRFMTATTPEGVAWKPLKYGRPGGGNRPLQDTGRLMASISSRSGAGEIVWFTNAPGAALQNFGGTVVPKKGKFLAIPLTREARRAGSPRRMTGTEQVPLFARRVAGRLVGHFLLVKKAVVPARVYMGLSRQALSAIAAAVAEDAARRWQQA
jgi:phage gpG-like protein